MILSGVPSNARARLSRFLAPVCLGATFLAFAVAACSVPEFDFQAPALGVGGDGASAVPHCRNGELDAELGESDFDCGRGCSPCGVAQHCTDGADCEDGLLCHEGSCVETGCMNGARDGNETDVDCGGDGCRRCLTDQACGEGSDCESDVCEGGKCLNAGCGDRVKNGRETGIDCGGDCDPCAADAPCVVAKDCISGECNDKVCGAVCVDGAANCDKDNANACEVDTRADVENCGSCGAACDLPNAGAECSGGECRIKNDGCEAGFLDCDGNPENGCEVDLKTNKLNCGVCHNACPDLNGSPSCEAGQCQIACSEGFADCDDKRDNGCEVNVLTSSLDCQTCGHKCAARPGYTPYCKDGTCGETQCAAGKGDCNGNPADACETTLTNDVSNCGGCGLECGAANANVSCVDSKCVIASCTGKYANCGGGYADGCETNTDTNDDHCGGCNKACGSSHASATSCSAGKCEPTCNSGWGRCTTPELGCVTPLGTTANCTRCGQACSGATPFCTASGCAGFREIVVVPSGVSATSGWIGNNGTPAEIRLNHNLQTPRSDAAGNANSRMVLVGVTATDNYTAMENFTVTYAGAPMNLAFEQLDPGKHSYSGVYYLLEANLPEAGNNRQVFASFGGTNTWGHAGVDVVELKNVMQVAPLAKVGDGVNMNCSPVATRSATVAFNQPGSLIYGILGARNASAAALVDNTISEITNRVQVMPERMVMASAYVFADGNRTIGWDVTGCYNTAISLVAIKRLSAN